jgi:hypothetical protein
VSRGEEKKEHKRREKNSATQIEIELRSEKMARRQHRNSA